MTYICLYLCLLFGSSVQFSGLKTTTSYSVLTNPQRRISLSRNFHNNANNIQARVTKTFSKAVRSEKAALATMYGALTGLGELGAEVITQLFYYHSLAST